MINWNNKMIHSIYTYITTYLQFKRNKKYQRTLWHTSFFKNQILSVKEVKDSLVSSTSCDYLLHTQKQWPKIKKSVEERLGVSPGGGGTQWKGGYGDVRPRWGAFLALQVFQWPLFILKQGFNIGCISTMGFVLGMLFTTGFYIGCKKLSF